MTTLIEKWYNKVKPYLFTYKKGFFVLPYINNTPQLMWQSLQTMPFIKFSQRLNRSESNSLFLHAMMYYQELEEDLVVFYNEIDYKRNVTFNHYRKKGIPQTYYCLTGLYSDSPNKYVKTIINEFHFNGILWILHKPDAVVRDYHFKDSRTKTIIIYFTDKWLKQYFKSFPEGNENLSNFIRSKSSSLGRVFEDRGIGMPLLEQASQLMKQEPSEDRKKQLEHLVPEILSFYKENCLHNLDRQEHFEIDSTDRLKVIEAEKLLIQSLNSEFPGISMIAEQVGMSETKLKIDFKQLFGMTIFQYYRTKQMDNARSILEQNSSSVKDVAFQFGYQNASKFSVAFKKHHGISPSELQQNFKSNPN